MYILCLLVYMLEQENTNKTNEYSILINIFNFAYLSFFGRRH